MKELKKELVENMSYKDITYLLLESEKSGLNTLELFTKIVNVLELPQSTIDNKIGDFYTSLTTDKRFVMIDGKWDLRDRYPSDKVIVKVDEDEELDELNELSDDLESEDDDMLDDVDDIDVDSDNDSYDVGDDDDYQDLVVIDEDELESEQ